jgi:hypothetical protein
MDRPKPEYPDPEWFTQELQSLRDRMDALVKLARSHGIEVKEIYPSRKTRLTLKEAAYQSVKRADHPLPLEEILDNLAQMGITPGGRRPANTLHATLSQDPRIRLVGVNTWALEEREAETPTTPARRTRPKA